MNTLISLKYCIKATQKRLFTNKTISHFNMNLKKYIKFEKFILLKNKKTIQISKTN